MTESTHEYRVILTGKHIPNREEIEKLVETAVGDMNLSQ